jgi:hypothetical protein
LNTDGLIHVTPQAGILAGVRAYESACPWKGDISQDDIGRFGKTALTNKGYESGNIDVSGAGRLTGCRLVDKTGSGLAMFVSDVRQEL